MSEPSVHTHCSSRKFGAHGYGAGGPSMREEVHGACWIERTGMSSVPGSGWEEVYPRSRCRVPNATGEPATVSGRAGGVSGARGEVWAGVAGCVGRSLLGSGVRRPRKRPSVKNGVRKKKCLPRREEACGLNCRTQDPMDPVAADECLPTLGVRDEDELHRTFCRKEYMCSLFGLFVCGDKPHVPRRDPDEGRHVVVAANCGGVPRWVFPNWEDQDH
jgi:hypothetical protein